MKEGWKEVRFGDVVQFPPKIKMKKGECYPFIPMENLDSGIKYVKPLIEKKLEGGGAKFEEGDTLFSRITPCLQNGKIAQAKNLDNKPGFGSTEYFVFRGIENKTDTNFIYYLSKTQWFKGNAENSMVGSSGRQRADAGFVRNLKINLPPLKTQRQIASILSAYDDLIENNLERIQLLEEQAQQTYEEWFVRFKFPGYETAQFDEESGLPVGWENTKLVKVIDFRVDNRGRNPKYYLDKGIPVLDNHLITNSPYVNLNNAKRFLDDELFDNFLRKYLKPNDVLITLVGTVGSLALAPKEKCAIIQNTIGLRCNSLCNPYFLFLFLKFNKQSVLNNNRGSAQPSVKVGDLLSIKLNLPDTNLLDEFKKICKPIFDQINNFGNQNQYLKEARDILLPRLMSGMIDVEQLEVGSLKYEVNDSLGMVAEGSETYNK